MQANLQMDGRWSRLVSPCQPEFSSVCHPIYNDSPCRSSVKSVIQWLINSGLCLREKIPGCNPVAGLRQAWISATRAGFLPQNMMFVREGCEFPGRISDIHFRLQEIYRLKLYIVYKFEFSMVETHLVKTPFKCNHGPYECVQ